MEEKEMTLERLFNMYDTEGFYVNMNFYKKTGVIVLGIEEKEEKREEEC